MKGRPCRLGISMDWHNAFCRLPSIFPRRLLDCNSIDARSTMHHKSHPRQTLHSKRCRKCLLCFRSCESCHREELRRILSAIWPGGKARVYWGATGRRTLCLNFICSGREGQSSESVLPAFCQLIQQSDSCSGDTAAMSHPESYGAGKIPFHQFPDNAEGGDQSRD